MKPHVLLVDDDQALLNGLKRVLRKEPYEIKSVSSAHAALDIMSHASVDVIVTDEEMPGMSGTELLALLRVQHPETIAIMLTGKASLDVALRAINSGEVYRLFTKPCSDVELALAIREALKQKELISQSRKLVDMTRKQAQYIEELERQNPGISKVDRTDSGAVISIPNQTMNLEEVIEEVTAELDRAEFLLSVRSKIRQRT